MEKPRTPEEFCARVEQLIRDARDNGITVDEIVTELDGICDSLADED